MTGCLYFDNNATTRPAPAMVEGMLPFYTEYWGNPSSLHRFGRDVAGPIETARARVAGLLGATRPSSVVFTSSGTEADNLALHGLTAAQPEKRHVVTTRVEHSAVLRYCCFLEETGYEVTWLPVARDGALDPGAVAAALRPDTACTAIMWANNETGVLFPVAAIAACCAARGVPLHVDAVQAAGKVPLDVEAVPVATLALSGHKIHGPKGIGALFIRRGTPFRPMLRGGGQEYGRRAGTENVPHIVGLGIAAELAAAHLPHVDTGVRNLRNRLEAGLLARIDGVRINGDREQRVANTTNVSFAGVDGEGLILALSAAGLAASTGSACSAGSVEPSHVLVAMGLDREALRGTLRLSLSRETTADEVDRALDIIADMVTARRRLNPR